MNNKIIRNRNRNKIKTDIVFKNGLFDNNLVSNKTVSNSKLDLFSKKRMDVRSKSSKLEIKNKSYYKYNNKVDNYFKMEGVQVILEWISKTIIGTHYY